MCNYNNRRTPQFPDENISNASILKGLVVRIGQNSTNHTLCSKTTTETKTTRETNNTKTTTKITIDMSPSPTNNEYPIFSSIKLPRATLHSLKSTPLVINTISKENQTNCSDLLKKNTKSAIPDQLAALKRLYDEASEHSDDSEKANEEVRSYMSGNGDESDQLEETRSVVSGSWSKMRAFRAIKQHLNTSSSNNKQNEFIKNIINQQSSAKRGRYDCYVRVKLQIG